MSFKPLPFALHAASTASMIYGWNTLHTLKIDEYVRGQKGGHFQFLTIQGLGLAGLTMTCGVVLDFFPGLTFVRSLKRGLMMVALPVEVVVTSIYWPLILYLPHFLMEQQENPSSSGMATSLPSEALQLFFLPLPVDLSLHFLPALALLVDFFAFEKGYGRKAKRRVAPAVALVFATWYAGSVEYFASFNGKFPYPFLTENTFPVRVAIYCGATFIALLSFWGINALKTGIYDNWFRRSSTAEITNPGFEDSARIRRWILFFVFTMFTFLLPTYRSDSFRL